MSQIFIGQNSLDKKLDGAQPKKSEQNSTRNNLHNELENPKTTLFDFSFNQNSFYESDEILDSQSDDSISDVSTSFSKNLKIITQNSEHLNGSYKNSKTSNPKNSNTYNFSLPGSMNSSTTNDIKHPAFYFSNNKFIQHGVIRTNCIDCLDRTNIAQFLIGFHVLEKFLIEIGIINESNNLSIDSKLASILKKMYEDLGDCIAYQYSGSNAHHMEQKVSKDTLKRHQLNNNFYTSIRRYYSNTFTDHSKQNSIDIFLGILQPHIDNNVLHVPESNDSKQTEPNQFYFLRYSDFSDPYEVKKPVLLPSINKNWYIYSLQIFAWTNYLPLLVTRMLSTYRVESPKHIEDTNLVSLKDILLESFRNVQEVNIHNDELQSNQTILDSFMKRHFQDATYRSESSKFSVSELDQSKKTSDANLTNASHFIEYDLPSLRCLTSLSSLSALDSTDLLQEMKSILQDNESTDKKYDDTNMMFTSIKLNPINEDYVEAYKFPLEIETSREKIESSHCALFKNSSKRMLVDYFSQYK